MNFFRMRVLNTLLFFFIGTLIGFILKERFYPARPASYPERYQPAYENGEQAASGSGPQIETIVEAEEPAEPEPDEPAEPEPRPRRKAAPAPEPDNDTAAVIEASTPEQAPAEASTPLVREARDEFFRRPADYAGRELEMELQLITAKRSPAGWRLNFVYTGPAKKIDYLYVDDAEILGENPDLRIGYVYRLRFSCSTGETAAGNSLLLLTPTGKKAAWATGISAIE
ncbi:MAG: hypothetical protein A2X35_10840 [Elusimicrobia bacterium GWA2_61_42]|nr:MAG: hypothetical protein A2X35_10840 [Elusimicrobia bacterium GWA2_61_42]OGR80446.1 MAG: hypothetical protein A2X38_03035 [Elusimicrobia bacterium GWC2_61_25]